MTFARLAIWCGVCISLVLASGPSVAESVPRPPCAGAPTPEYAPVGRLPAVRVWSGDQIGTDWIPPACTRWQPRALRTLVATAGLFTLEGGVKSLLVRFAAVSKLATIRYWSVSDERWENLVTHASALSGPDSAAERRDFQPEEMVDGAELYFTQNDNRSTGEVVYRLRLQDMGPDRLVIETENVSPMRYLLIQLAAPGDLQALYFFARRTADTWSYYSLARTASTTSFLLGGHAPSYINRAVALFRHLAGLPTDQEPPAAP